MSAQAFEAPVPAQRASADAMETRASPREGVARLDAIDVIRALAAGSVVYAHWCAHALAALGDYPTVRKAIVAAGVPLTYGFWANAGLHPGVIVFIVLSGFCIHLPLATKPALAARPGFWRSYALRRALRIYPVLVVCMIGGQLLAAFANDAARKTGFVDGAPDVSNFLLSLTSARAFAPLTPPRGDPILDTVLVECALYAFYPVVLLVRGRFGWRAMLLLAAAVYGCCLPLLVKGADPTWVGRSFYAFLLYWALGAWAAERFAQNRGRPFERRSAVFLLGAFAGYVAIGLLVRFKGSHMLYSALLAAITAWGLTMLRPRAAGGRTIATVVLEWIGLQSYSLYAVHVLVLVVLAQMMWRGVVAAFAPLAAIALATIALYRLVERPSHRLAVRITSSALPSAADRRR